MAGSADLPRPLVALHDALQPVSRLLADRPSGKPAPPESLRTDALPFIEDHLIRLEQHVLRLNDVLNQHLRSAVYPEPAEPDILRAVARLEARIELALDDYDTVRRTKAVAEDAKGVSLFCGVYRDTLRQIERWINLIIAALDNPEAEAIRRGLPMTGHVELRFALSIASPSELSDLERWVSERRQCQEPDSWRPAMRIVGWVAAAFGIGWLLGGDDGDV